MKTAVCFSDTCSSLDHTYKNIQSKILDPLGDCDLFFVGPPTSHSTKFLNHFSSYTIRNFILEDPINWDVNKYTFRPNWPLPTSSPLIFLQMVQSRYKLGLSLKSFVDRYGVKYDRVIFSRLDLFFFNNITEATKGLPLAPNTVRIPDFHCFTGVNDRFALGDYFSMVKYLNLWENLFPFMRESGPLHAETSLGWHLASESISTEKMHFRFSRVRSSGESIDERLREPVLVEADK